MPTIANENLCLGKKIKDPLAVLQTTNNMTANNNWTESRTFDMYTLETRGMPGTESLI